MAKEEKNEDTALAEKAPDKSVKGWVPKAEFHTGPMNDAIAILGEMGVKADKDAVLKIARSGKAYELARAIEKVLV